MEYSKIGQLDSLQCFVLVITTITDHYAKHLQRSKRFTGFEEETYYILEICSSTGHVIVQVRKGKFSQAKKTITCDQSTFPSMVVGMLLSGQSLSPAFDICQKTAFITKDQSSPLPHFITLLCLLGGSEKRRRDSTVIRLRGERSEEGGEKWRKKARGRGEINPIKSWDSVPGVLLDTSTLIEQYNNFELQYVSRFNEPKLFSSKAKKMEKGRTVQFMLL
ncbi:hypothetical protein C4D60_Mb02t19190 [Musa balbisiana]|uniref:Uncharacterized protein n=1 Tax=Musa balbisiana TaxID=52838 RepID=A0A4S8IE61_MUSBA|nr:hypothetical protein C4D60_Mb02t19190 [Musa balbisiana]